MKNSDSRNNTESQLGHFKKGFPWLDIVAAATSERGIEQVDEARALELCDYLDKAEVAGKCKFVPASGAASRMFKDIFAGLDNPNESTKTLEDNIRKFAFYDPEVFDSKNVPGQLLNEQGLGYGSKPKGVLKFHRYPDEVRTALAEHLVEGQRYMRDKDDTVNIVFTISEEHRQLFEQALEEVKEKYEKRYSVKYNVSFTYQDKSTDTIAVTPDNRPFLKEDGSILRRPAGHGALIYNLTEVPQELVSVKNIDNVCSEKLLDITAKYKRVLMGRALQLRDRIFGYIYALRQIESSGIAELPMSNVLRSHLALQEDVWATDDAQELCNEIEQFLFDELCIEMPEAHDCRSRAMALLKKLDRPVRVCGMVRNLGEPGGGPYIIRAKDGSTSLQILESVQIDTNNPQAVKAMSDSAYFNPVDIVCCINNIDGQRFNLPDFVDEQTGFISFKSYQGRELKALELPGLWNGSMSDWNTVFVEVPVETFNPVKVVLDLLRDTHQM